MSALMRSGEVRGDEAFYIVRLKMFPKWNKEIRLPVQNVIT